MENVFTLRVLLAVPSFHTDGHCWISLNALLISRWFIFLTNGTVFRLVLVLNILKDHIQFALHLQIIITHYGINYDLDLACMRII